VCSVCPGYQAEDGEMVTLSSPATCTDADSVTLYSADLDVTVGTSSAAGSAGDSDLTAGALPVTNVQQPLPHTDLCDDVLPQRGMTELPEFEDQNTENGEYRHYCI